MIPETARPRCSTTRPGEESTSIPTSKITSGLVHFSSAADNLHLHVGAFPAASALPNLSNADETGPIRHRSAPHRGLARFTPCLHRSVSVCPYRAAQGFQVPTAAEASPHTYAHWRLGRVGVVPISTPGSPETTAVAAATPLLTTARSEFYFRRRSANFPPLFYSSSCSSPSSTSSHHSPLRHIGRLTRPIVSHSAPHLYISAALTTITPSRR